MQSRSWMVLGLFLTLALSGGVRAEPAGSAQDVPPRLRGLFAALEDPSPLVSALALDHLRHEELDAPGVRERLRAFVLAPRMRELLVAEDWTVQYSAVMVVGEAGEAAQAHLSQLEVLLKDPHHEVRYAAVQTVGRLGSLASAQIPLLLNLVHDENWLVQQSVGEALEKLGPLAEPQVLLLTRRLEDPDGKVRRDVLRVLESMGAAASAGSSQIARLLQDPDAELRHRALEVLGRMGPAASAQAALIAGRLDDENPRVRHEALRVLGLLRAGASPYLQRIAGLARKRGDSTQATALWALGRLGPAAKEHSPLLLEVLADTTQEAEVRASAAEALGQMGKGPHVQQLFALLERGDEKTVALARRALVRLGDEAPAFAPSVARLLEAKDLELRLLALEVLREMGQAASGQAPQVAALLVEKNDRLLLSAFRVLEVLGPAASAQAPLVVPFLKREQRAAAAELLGRMGPAASAQASHVAELLHDDEDEVRLAALRALLAMGAVGRAQIPQLLGLVQDPNKEISQKVREVLMRHGEPGEAAMAAVLAAALDASALERSLWLVLAHGMGGGEPGMERLVRWVGRAPEELPSELSEEEARATLQAFAAFWPRTEQYPTLRKELARQVAEVARLGRGRWKAADVALLQQHEHNLKPLHPTQAELLGAVIASDERWNSLRRLGWGWTVHAVFWLLLLFAYPRSPQVQAFFFWNPWVRRVTGFGYVGLLLTWVPFLRRRLLSPFGPLLLAEARLEGFSASAYFDRAEVLRHGSAQREPLLRVLPRVHGQVVLEGASGLGKSMFLKYLLATSERLAVYLTAERCKEGVLEAIQAKLEGQARDATFLRSLIYSGGLDIYIDGLNEVTADTRARIVQFVERNVHGNILLTTQPMEWTPPATAKRYVLQPLTEEQVARFLESREPVLGEKARVRGQAYLEACQHFVADALSAELPVELRQANAEVLSNPMDLTVVAQMLADGRQPDLFKLHEQQYALLAREYQEVHRADFPLKALAEETYAMRCEDRSVIPEERFGRELLRMEAAKMVLRQQWKGPEGKEVREWRFRHDKIQEFFIAQTFRGEDNTRATEHLKDPRFRGVYLLLALLLEPEKGRLLCELLVEYAAETRDHSVSDDFVNLLKKRQRAEKARAARARRAAAKEA